MANNLSDIEYRLFKDLICEKCGIEITEDKAYLIESRLSKMLADSGCTSFIELYRLLTNSRDPKMIDKLVEAITTNETLWFRDKAPWALLEDVFLPRFIEMLRNGKRKRISIWSAATSTGQEAYSTAICINEYLKTRLIRDITLQHFDIYATDISKHVLDIAKSGRYDSISIMRGLDKNLRNKYFTNCETYWQLSDEIRNAVMFDNFNLLNDFHRLKTFDIVFCRYVLIYFADSLKKDLLKKIYNVTNDNGVLFLGSYEMYSHLNINFQIVHDDKGTYYTKSDIGGAFGT